MWFKSTGDAQASLPLCFPPAIRNPPWLPETRMTGGFCRRSVKADSQGELRRRAIYNQQQYISAMSTQLDKIVQEAAEKCHEHFESVRSDPLRVPDSDVTEAIIRRAIADAVRESGAMEALPVLRQEYVEQAMDLGAWGDDFKNDTPLINFDTALANLRALAGETDGEEKE